ncbi:MAG: hypothetical protein L0Y56_09875, partial [Nitrospira sp.]|nr:hypothetical protein [Nitrospira sp.]
MKHPIRRRLIYLGFQGLRNIVQFLPFSCARILGVGFGLTAYGLLRTQRQLTLEHLSYALGDSLSAAQRWQVARRLFENLGQTFIEWLRFPKLSSGEIKKLVTGEGVDHVKRVLSEGNGA